MTESHGGEVHSVYLCVFCGELIGLRTHQEGRRLADRIAFIREPHIFLTLQHSENAKHVDPRHAVGETLPLLIQYLGLWSEAAPGRYPVAF